MNTEERRTSEMVRESAISNGSAVFGAPDIMATDKDSRFVGGVFHEFRTTRNIIPQSVIPGNHQSLGATGSRDGLFRTSMDHVIGNRKPSSLVRREWGEFAAMTTMRLNSQVRQFGGFAPGRRVFGRTPKMPIGAAGNPHFDDFMNQKEAPAAKTHHLLGAIQKIRHASLNGDFVNKFNLSFRKRDR